MRLPDGRYFSVTWDIPDHFGGMTSALLRRSRSFVRIGGRPVDILTFEVRDDWPERERMLQERGELIDGMRLINIWRWLCENDLTPGKVRHEAPPLVGERLLRDGRGDVVQIDHYRDDGSLAVVDRRHGDSRTIILHDRHGAPVRSFGGAWGLYRWWLDQVTGRRRSWLLVDSKTAANPLMSYRRRHATTVHIVHNAHRGSRPGSIRASRRRVFEDLAAFDAVVFLTERQRRDVVEQFGRPTVFGVVPNSRDLPAAMPGERSGAVVLASLTSRKRVDHAIRAAVAARVHLDIYGTGELRGSLEKLVSDLGAGDVVRLRGHDSRAVEAFDRASVAILTGSSEGLPLTLVEAMAAGCVPVAYDVPYGPSDLIRDGRTGRLVPDGDEPGLARAIASIATAPVFDVERMRRAGRRTARSYSDRAVVRRWAILLWRLERRRLVARLVRRRPQRP